ncbi:hypothetical protein B0H21DRAFT_740245 [Amylocystis lapponica]|nr:hypothetical protein B0H21DRAFT_740245 [Amylocystis lapponica]
MTPHLSSSGLRHRWNRTGQRSGDAALQGWRARPASHHSLALCLHTTTTPRTHRTMSTVAFTSIRNRLGPSIAIPPSRLDAIPKAKSDADASPLDSPGVLKAVREYEHDRHHTKKAAEHERTRERKERRRFRPHSGRAVHVRRVSGRAIAVGPEVEEQAALETPEDLERPEVVAEDVGPVGESMLELDIAPLMKPAKARKRKAEDFEVIPSVRSVIVLDEHAAAELEIDEPWEHVTADDQEGEKVEPPSYARVVACAA